MKTVMFEDLPETIQAERDALHNACGEAYVKTGTVRSPEWQAASKALLDHEIKYGAEYNPD